MKFEFAFRLFMGILCLCCMAYLFREKVASRIRNSRLWFLGWAGYMFSLVSAFHFLAPLYQGPQPSEETVMGIFFTVALLILAGCFGWVIFLTSRWRKQAKG